MVSRTIDTGGMVPFVAPNSVVADNLFMAERCPLEPENGHR